MFNKKQPLKMEGILQNDNIFSCSKSVQLKSTQILFRAFFREYFFILDYTKLIKK